MTAPNTRTPAKRPDQPDDGRNKRILFAGVLVAIIGLSLLNRGGEDRPDAGEVVAYTELLDLIDDGKVTEAWLEPGRVIVEVGAVSNVHSTVPADTTDELVSNLVDAGIELNVLEAERGNALVAWLLAMSPVFFIIAFLVFLMRKGSLGGGSALALGKSRAVPVEIPNVRFSDVAGVDEAVAELQEAVDFLHNPDRYTRTGAKAPRGFLLVGAPGTGKTLLARAVAGEAGVPFFAITGSDFVEMFVGLGASRVRDLFAKVRAQEKAILFIDEIDAVGKARGKGMQTGANDERENTLNQLLVEMDGFSARGSIVVLAATNRADVLDPALLRPGRFDRRIVVPAPDRRGRERIFELYSRSRPFDRSTDWAAIAKRTPGMTGAEIEQMLNEAALEAARQESPRITAEHLEHALATTVLGRARKSAVVSERDRSIVAWHEAGHTVAAMVLPDAQDPVQVTIVPRGPAGGVTWMNGSDDDFMTRSQALAQLTVALAGRAAEEILLDGDFTQGAHGDLDSATRLATLMVTRYGMGAHLIARDNDRMMLDGPVSERVDAEVTDMLGDAMQHARNLLAANETLLRRVAASLLENETLSYAELEVLRAEVAASDGVPGQA